MKRLAVLIVIFALGISVGLIADHHWRSARTFGQTDGQRVMVASGHRETAMEHARRHLDPKYVCPMHPNVVQDHPGNCPICGMKLVARQDDATTSQTAVVLSPAVISEIGVRTVKARRGTIQRHIEAPGYVASRIGLPLAAPKPDSHTGSSPSAAPPVQIWAQVFENQAPFVQPGQSVELRLPQVSAKVWKGKIEYVDPQLNLTTRTLQVRVLADLEGTTVKPNMYAEVSIETDPVTDALIVPSDALIETGSADRVIVATGNGRFEPREVVAERITDDEVSVLSGLKEGEAVVVSAQFMLDSEASLRAGLARLTDEPMDGRQVAERSGQ